MAANDDRHPEGARSAVLKDAPKPAIRRYRLTDLLKGMTPEAMHDALDWGEDVGHEVVD